MESGEISQTAKSLWNKHTPAYFKVGLYQVLANYTIPILYWWKNLLYYTIPIPILYQFLGGLFMALCFLHRKNPFKNVRGIKTFSWVTQSFCPPTPPLHSTLHQLLNTVALLLKKWRKRAGGKVAEYRYVYLEKLRALLGLPRKYWFYCSAWLELNWENFENDMNKNWKKKNKVTMI